MGFTGTDKEKTSYTFDLQLARDKIPNMENIFIPGFANSVSSTERQVWNGPPAEEFRPTDPASTSIVSSSTDDDFSGGIGGQVISLQGIDKDFNRVSELALLQGTTTVTLLHKYIKINFAAIVQTGTAKINQGNITIYNESDISQVMTFLNIKMGLAQSSSFLVPKGHTLYLKQLTVGTEKNADLLVKIGLSFANGSRIFFELLVYENFADFNFHYFKVSEKETTFLIASQQSGTASLSTAMFAVLETNNGI